MGFPPALNRILLKMNIAPAMCYGRRYLKRKKELKRSGSGDFEERLADVVNTAIKYTPYYSKLYSDPVSGIREFEERIGFITRNTLTEHYDELISSTIDRGKYTDITTGGTSGRPVRFLVPADRHIVELSTMHSMWERAGWHYHSRAVLRNHKLRAEEIVRINPVTKEFIFDNFRQSPGYARQIYEILLRYNISFIHGYPSAVYQFCLLCREQSLDLGFIKACLCGSESIMDFQRKLIADEMGLKIYNWYGHSEKLVLGGYCEYSTDFHIEPLYGYFELIDENGMRVNTPGSKGEIVGTTIYNYGMPLIRYRTGDYAEYVSDHCEKCGRRMPIIRNIEGRWQHNQIFRKDGTYITTTALNLHSKLYAVIDGLQYIQEQPGILKVLIIKHDHFKSEHEKIFLKHFSDAMGPDSEVEIEYVDSLIYQPNGKFVQLISKIQ